MSYKIILRVSFHSNVWDAFMRGWGRASFVSFSESKFSYCTFYSITITKIFLCTFYCTFITLMVSFERAWFWVSPIYLKNTFVFVKKVCFLLTSNFVLLKTSFSLIDFDMIYPIQSSKSLLNLGSNLKKITTKKTPHFFTQKLIFIDKKIFFQFEIGYILLDLK